MPNLLPNWTQTLPWDMGDVNLRAAGRLIWGILLLVVGLAFFVTLLKAPRLKRPFPTAIGIAIVPGIIVGGLVLGKLIPSVQRTIVWLALLALVLHGLAMVASRTPRDPEQPATWAECFAGAVGVFALFVLGYAVVPSEWLNYANAHLNWGDNTKFVFTSHMKVFGILGVHYPFSLDFPALRDIVVTMIYVVVLGLNLKLWVMWQRRFEVKAEPAEGEGGVLRRSRFGRPLRRSTVSAGAAPEGA